MLSPDAWAFCVCVVVAQLTVKSVELLRDYGVLGVYLARKVVHILTGTVFLYMWPLFSPAPTARYWAAVVPALVTLRFALVGAGVLKDPKLVAGVARTGRAQELLLGPVWYGLAHVVLVLAAWRDHPAGALGLASVCWGDGLADVVGRALGKQRVPWSKHKTLAGSTACFLGGWLAGLAFCAGFQHLGYFTVSSSSLLYGSLVCSLVGALVESFDPLLEADNVLVAGAVALSAFLIF